MENCATSVTKVSGNNVLILHFFSFQQEFFNFLVTNLSRPRDYYQHTSDPLFMLYAYELEMIKIAPVFVLVKTIADHINYTVLTESCVFEQNISSHYLSQIYVHVDEHAGSVYNLQNIWTQNRNSIQIFRFTGSGFNFIYCDIPKIQLEPMWDVQHLTNAFDANIWLLTGFGFCCFLFLIVVKRWAFGGNVTNEDLCLSAFNVFAMLLPNPLTNVEKVIRQHTTLMIWFFSGLVLNNCFSAAITSTIIKPPPEFSLSTFVELAHNNYKIKFGSSHEYILLTTALRSHLKVISSGHDAKEKQSLERLMRDNFEIPGETNEEISEDLAFGTNVASVVMEESILAVLTKANEALQSDRIRGMGRRCYTGRKLVPTGDFYNALLGPKVYILGTPARRLITTGIVDMWLRESYGVSYANRVQDRLRVVRKTKYTYGNFGDDSNNSPKPLPLYGRVKSMFFIYCVGVMLGIFSLVCETLVVLATRFRKSPLSYRHFEFHP